MKLKDLLGIIYFLSIGLIFILILGLAIYTIIQIFLCSISMVIAIIGALSVLAIFLSKYK